MKFIWKFFVKEFTRNLARILLSIGITLILFMSAFTLCNLASALPKNFYNYYNTYLQEEILITVNDADNVLLEQMPNYFQSYELDSFIYHWKSFSYADKECKSYKATEDDGVTFITYYHSALTNPADGFFSSTNIWEKFNFETNSYKWYESYTDTSDNATHAPFTQRGVWISNIIADNLGIDNTHIGQNIEFNINDNYSCELRVLGIYDYTSAQATFTKREAENLAYFYVNVGEADAIYLATHSQYKVTGKLANVSELYELYNSLGKRYNLADSYVMDMLTSVKNAEILCGIIGAIMLVGGLVIMLNFLSMFISSNTKNIGLYSALGAKQKYISLAYLLIFFVMISIACVISWAVLPIYNLIVEFYCASIGYDFVIALNYGVVGGLFFSAYLATALLMLFKHLRMQRTMPTELLKEED